MSTCFHCGEPIPPGVRIECEIEGEPRSMCCMGCRAVAEFINTQGHRAFYRHRQDSLPRTPAKPPEADYSELDRPALRAVLCETGADGLSTTALRVEDMYCSACSWLIDRQLRACEGVADVQVNSVSKTVRVRFDADKTPLSRIHRSVAELGYHPLRLNSAQPAAVQLHREYLKKIIVSGLGMMFILTLSVPLYADQRQLMDPALQRFFVLLSLLIGTAVYFYAGRLFLQHAWRDLRHRHLGMDVPVALSITLAYAFSVYFSLFSSGPVYFDSMSMFVFFLLAGRYVEMRVRHQGLSVRDAIGALIPAAVERLDAEDATQHVPLTALHKGEVVKVRAGGVIPVDGVIVHSQPPRVDVDESLLSGEATPRARTAGEAVLAGARLLNGEVTVRSTALGEQSFIGRLTALMESAMAQRPRTLQLVDRIAAHFVAAVLLLAALTALWHWQAHSGLALTATLSVLVATCPCALSLATPTALSAMSLHFFRLGVLVNNADAMSRLHRAQVWVFDKTGTLTESAMRVAASHLLSEPPPTGLTAALQSRSHHPIAAAFTAQAEAVPITWLEEFEGRGVQGVCAGRTWRMGRGDWVAALSGVDLPSLDCDPENTLVWLGHDASLVALYELRTAMRDGAQALVQRLQDSGRTVILLSGDRASAVQSVARTLGVSEWHAEQSTDDKMRCIEAWQQRGEMVAMVGDGINDAPVLSRADVSISLRQGAHLAHAASDVIVMGQSLSAIDPAVRASARAQRVIRQNIAWAIVYNLGVTPLAMAGVLQPWLAALGMSASSLLVVLNSRRLL